jgi:hypothetical protein
MEKEKKMTTKLKEIKENNTLRSRKLKINQ